MCYYNQNAFYFLVFCHVFQSCLLEDDIHIETKYIIIQDELTPFKQMVDISSLKQSDMLICTDVSCSYCVKWKEYALFNVSSEGNCKDFEYKSTSREELSVKFYTHNIHMYGGAEQDLQKWPIETSNYSLFPYVSSQVNSQAVLESFWLFSTGQYLYVYDDVPLFISVNKDNNTFELIASNRIPYRSKNVTVTRLKYRVCKFADMKVAYLHAANNLFNRSKKIPDTETIQKPVWSTWVKYKSNISEHVVTEFVDDILSRKFIISHVEIDDKWEICYGSLTFDRVRFPNMKRLVQSFRKKGVSTTLWVHPFINEECQPYYDEALKNGYFVNGSNGVNTKWWNGVGGYIDFTNVNASRWFRNRLQAIQNDTGIQSFKFDAGESGWLPINPIFRTSSRDYPETNLKSYVQIAASFGKMVEVRVGKGTQKYPIFVRMIDRESTWSGRLGLSTLIPTLLLMNIIGYPFVLPDMIGGNLYNNQTMDAELFIRWLQVNVFMPSLQFSVPPWDIDESVTNVAAKMVKLHKSFANEIMHAMKEFVVKGTPVNPPLWWNDPKDTETYTIDTEFMLGEKILVAPILTKGATKRDIYLPKGVWRDENNKKSKLIMGPKWLRDYPADIKTVPYFTRTDLSNDAASSKDYQRIFVVLIVLAYSIPVIVF